MRNEELLKIKLEYENKIEELKNKIINTLKNSLIKYPVYEIFNEYEFEYILKTLYENNGNLENISFNLENIKQPKKRYKKIKKESTNFENSNFAEGEYLSE